MSPMSASAVRSGTRMAAAGAWALVATVAGPIPANATPTPGPDDPSCDTSVATGCDDATPEDSVDKGTTRGTYPGRWW